MMWKNSNIKRIEELSLGDMCLLSVDNYLVWCLLGLNFRFLITSVDVIHAVSRLKIDANLGLYIVLFVFNLD